MKRRGLRPGELGQRIMRFSLERIEYYMGSPDALRNRDFADDVDTPALSASPLPETWSASPVLPENLLSDRDRPSGNTSPFSGTAPQPIITRQPSQPAPPAQPVRRSPAPQSPSQPTVTPADTSPFAGGKTPPDLLWLLQAHEERIAAEAEAKAAEETSPEAARPAITDVLQEVQQSSAGHRMRRRMLDERLSSPAADSMPEDEPASEAPDSEIYQAETPDFNFQANVDSQPVQRAALDTTPPTSTKSPVQDTPAPISEASAEPETVWSYEFDHSADINDSDLSDSETELLKSVQPVQRKAVPETPASPQRDTGATGSGDSATSPISEPPIQRQPAVLPASDSVPAVDSSDPDAEDLSGHFADEQTPPVSSPPAPAITGADLSVQRMPQMESGSSDDSGGVNAVADHIDHDPADTDFSLPSLDDDNEQYRDTERIDYNTGAMFNLLKPVRNAAARQFPSLDETSFELPQPTPKPVAPPPGVGGRLLNAQPEAVTAQAPAPATTAPIRRAPAVPVPAAAAPVVETAPDYPAAPGIPPAPISPERPHLFEALLEAGAVQLKHEAERRLPDSPFVQRMEDIPPQEYADADEWISGDSSDAVVPHQNSPEADLLRLLNLPTDTPVVGLNSGTVRHESNRSSAAPRSAGQTPPTIHRSPVERSTNDHNLITRSADDLGSALAASSSAALTPATNSEHSEASGQAANQPDIDKLARDVLRRLRRQLRTDQERRSDK